MKPYTNESEIPILAHHYAWVGIGIGVDDIATIKQNWEMYSLFVQKGIFIQE